MSGPLERLWNGWRNAYVTGVDHPKWEGTGSVFTRILNSGLTDDECNIVRRAEHCFVILNAFPYGVGHLMVLPYREVAHLEDLTVEEHAELWSLVTDASQALRTAYRPEGLNVGINLGRAAGGSISEHLHVHLVPRWTGDANFMTSTANTRTIPEALPVTLSKVRSAWPTTSRSARRH